MPDSVIVYQKDTDRAYPRTHYSNSMMNGLFNCNLLNFHASQSRAKNALTEKSADSLSSLPIRKKHPLLRRVFTQITHAEEQEYRQTTGMKLVNEPQLESVDQSDDMVLKSLHEIVVNQQQQRREGSMERQRYRVRQTNRYDTNQTSVRIVQVKLIDLIFNSKPCTLVLVQDLTQVIEDWRKQRKYSTLILASSGVTSAIY